MSYNIPQQIPLNSSPEFVTNPVQVRTRTIDLTTARSNELVEIGNFNFIWAVASNSITAELDVVIESESNDPIPFKEGLQITIPGSKIYLSNTAQSGKTITLMFLLQTQGTVNIKNSSSGLSQVTLATPSGISTQENVSAVNATTTTLVSANVSRKEVFITNTSTSATVYLGDNSNVSTTRGLPLNPKSTVVLSTASEVSCYNGSGSNIDMGIMELTI